MLSSNSHFYIREGAFLVARAGFLSFLYPSLKTVRSRSSWFDHMMVLARYWKPFITITMVKLTLATDGSDKNVLFSTTRI